MTPQHSRRLIAAALFVALLFVGCAPVMYDLHMLGNTYGDCNEFSVCGQELR